MALVMANPIQELTKVTLRHFVEANKMALVGFVLPWIPSHQRFSREFEEAARVLRDSGVQFAVLDCEKEMGMHEQFRFNRWPNVKLFRGFANVKVYEGLWKASDIVSWITRQRLPLISTVTADTLQDLKGKSNVVVVGYFATDHNASSEAFNSVAEDLQDDYMFGITNDIALAKQEQTNVPSIVLYKDFDERRNTFEMTHDSQAISAFVKAAATPLVMEFFPELHYNYIDTGLHIGYLLTPPTSSRTELSKALSPIAAQHKSTLLLGTADPSIYPSLAENLHLTFPTQPEPLHPSTFCIRSSTTGHCYPLPPSHHHPLTPSTLSTHITAFLSSTLVPTLKSAPTPPLSGPITTIVAAAFVPLVLEADKDVLVYYHTPWCGPCDAIAPIYARLAGLYAPHAEYVTIASMDADANDVRADVKGFPWFQLFPAGKTKMKPATYGGEPTLEGLAGFLRDEGTHGIDVLGGGEEQEEE